MENFSEQEVKKLKVLVVDDDPQIRRLIRLILESRFTFTVLEAEDGVKALARIDMDMPFLVILDIMMPEMDGIAVLKEIRKKEELKDLPVIICSAVSERSKVLELYSEGIADYIIKPINPIVFSNKVTQYLKQHLEKIIKKVYLNKEV
jgi:two-component system, OmpR family, response regulator